MISYIVYYKSTGLFRKWKKIKKVKGDGLMENGLSRFFILDDETRIEIPVHYTFRFSKERFLSIEERMKQEAKQPINLDKK